MATQETILEVDRHEEIGRGQFGVVHRATVRPHGTVAAKVLNASRFSGDWEDIKAHLFREAENLQKAQHPNVVGFHGVTYGQGRDEVIIITELCDRALGTMAAGGPLPLEVARKHVREALTGLEALHSRGMVHRDIKPANILVGGGCAKISDFGVTTDRLVAGYASQAGYLEHLAPEFFLSGVTSFKTDVWAMGLTIFRLLVGEPWYEDIRTALGIEKSEPLRGSRIEQLVTSGGFVRGLKWLPHVPAPWRRFVHKAMSTDSANRFQDGGQMLSALAHLPGGPSWTCEWSSGMVRWHRARDGGRQEVVEWTRHSPRNQEIEGYFGPAAGGSSRKLTFAPRSRLSGTMAALQTLRRVFETRTE